MNAAFVLGAILAAVALPATQAWATTVIDHFDSGAFGTLTVQGVNGQTTSSGNIAAGVLGGYRNVILTLVDKGSGALNSNSELSIVLPSVHELSWNNQDGNRSQLEVQYFGAGSGFAATDLTGGGTNTQWVFAYGDYATGSAWERVTIKAYSASGSTTWQMDLQNTPAGSGGMAVIPFSSGVGSADMAAITKLDYVFDMTPSLTGGANYSFDALETGNVPEPLTMLGLLASVGGVGAYIRKRRAVVQ